ICDGVDVAACSSGACRANCTCAPPPVCGDGIVNQVSEQCDGASAAACPGQCKADCTCPFCGDNIVQGTEVCDGTADAACPGGCTAACTCTPGTEVPIATVVADTYVASNVPTTNFGTAANLGADASPTEIMFLRINVTGVGVRTVTSAILRMQVSNVSNL